MKIREGAMPTEYLMLRMSNIIYIRVVDGSYAKALHIFGDGRFASDVITLNSAIKELGYKYVDDTAPQVVLNYIRNI